MITICEEAALPEGGAVRVETDGPIAVFRSEGELYAIDDTCTHQSASLSDGWVEDCTVECPLHAVCFDLRTGMPNGPPARTPVRTHSVWVEDGWVVLEPASTPVAPLAPASTPVAPLAPAGVPATVAWAS